MVKGVDRAEACQLPVGSMSSDVLKRCLGLFLHIVFQGSILFLKHFCSISGSDTPAKQSVPREWLPRAKPKTLLLRLRGVNTQFAPPPIHAQLG